jgi:thiosulfate reductase cytochrome b subunit
MKRLEPKHPLATRWFHWINVPLLGVMIWSGWLIYWANDVYRLGWGSVTLVTFFPQRFYDAFGVPYHLAKGMAWHFFFMWAFGINGLLYVLYTTLSGEWRDLLPDRHSFQEAVRVILHDLHLSRVAPPRRKYNGAQRIAYTGIILMGLGSLLTGLAIYKPVRFAWLTAALGGYQMARLEHFCLMLGYLLFFIVHLAQVCRAGWNTFRAMVAGYEVFDDEGASLE